MVIADRQSTRIPSLEGYVVNFDQFATPLPLNTKRGKLY